MPPEPSATASGEAGFLSALTREELAAHWIREVKRAAAALDVPGRRRSGRWAAVGRDQRLRSVEREFIRRLLERAEEQEQLGLAFELRGFFDVG